MEFETLYKRSSSGAILEWTISTNGDLVITEAGQVGGAITTSTYCATDKNIGRANYVNAIDQAGLEAKSKFDHQIKYNGYFRTIEAAFKADVFLPAGGYKPMKAHKYKDHFKKFPNMFMVQPKIDGIRCIAMKVDGVVKLFKSSGREAFGFNHIKEELNVVMIDNDILDGEFYCHGMPLERINSIVSCTVNLKSEALQRKLSYYIFDAIRIRNVNYLDRFEVRFNAVRELFQIDTDNAFDAIRLVETRLTTKAEEEAIYREYVAFGYEGMMYRLLDGIYDNKPKRSYVILKRKEFEDDEFLIVGVEDGIGKAAGLAVNFVCLLDNGETFKAPINNTEEYRVKLWNNHEMWKGKYATVRFLNYSEYGVPVIPKCIAIRDQKGVD